MSLFDEDPSVVIDFAKRWSDLGWAIQEQIEKILDNPDNNCNKNAVKFALNHLKGYNEQLDDELIDWLNRR